MHDVFLLLSLLAFMILTIWMIQGLENLKVK
jgi:hypothetical protein